MGQARLDDYRDRISAAKKAEYIGFLSRHPFACDAYSAGYAVGFREDGSFQDREYPNVDIPVNILDNEFRNPDLDRYRERFEQLEPDVGIVGDAYTEQEAQDILQVVDDLRDEHPSSSFVAVPKCREALEVFSDQTVLGYPNGYSDVSPDEFSDIVDWRNEQLWILGGNPHDQHTVIDLLTQPTIDGQPPADIVGLDGNGCFKAALYGEYWTADGYAPADHLSIRGTVSNSLYEIKAFWQSLGVWPDTTPLEAHGPAVVEPDDMVYARSGDDIRTQEDLETAYVERYDDRHTLAFASETAQRFVEYREGLLEP